MQATIDHSTDSHHSAALQPTVLIPNNCPSFSSPPLLGIAMRWRRIDPVLPPQIPRRLEYMMFRLQVLPVEDMFLQRGINSIHPLLAQLCPRRSWLRKGTRYLLDDDTYKVVALLATNVGVGSGERYEQDDDILVLSAMPL